MLLGDQPDQFLALSLGNLSRNADVFFFFGFVLYGSIMLLPLFLQTLMGYDATLAGWALAQSASSSRP